MTECPTDRRAGRCVPEPCCSVSAPGEYGLAVRTEGHASHSPRMLHRQTDGLPDSIPEPRRPIPAARHQGFAIGAEGYRIDFALVCQGQAEGLPDGGVPELRGRIEAPREDALA